MSDSLPRLLIGAKGSGKIGPLFPLPTVLRPRDWPTDRRANDGTYIHDSLLPDRDAICEGHGIRGCEPITGRSSHSITRKASKESVPPTKKMTDGSSTRRLRPMGASRVKMGSERSNMMKPPKTTAAAISPQTSGLALLTSRSPRESLLPPSFSKVWIAGYTGKNAGYCRGYTLTGVTKDIDRPHVNVANADIEATTFGASAFFFQVLTVRNPTADPARLHLRRKDGPWLNACRQIWPVVTEKVRWPPPLTLDDVNVTPEAFSNSWYQALS